MRRQLSSAFGAWRQHVEAEHQLDCRMHADYSLARPPQAPRAFQWLGDPDSAGASRQAGRHGGMLHQQALV